MKLTLSAFLQRRTLHEAALTAAAGAFAALLTGCAVSSNMAANKTNPITNSGGNYQGRVFGGQQPIAGSTIQLYSVNTTGVSGASTPLLTQAVVSDANGNFTFTNLYSCTSATLVYVTATGGNAGAGANSAIAEMATLGPCSSLTSSTFLIINELTTVAAVYALSPFMTGYANVGAVGSNPAGLVSAFNTAQALVTTGTGQIPAPNAGVTLPVQRLNTLADALAACVNSTGSGSAECSTLFTATGATNTVGAVLYIAKNPGSTNSTGLWNLGTSSPPFQPTLTAQPNDFTLAVNYTGAELLSPYSLALDANGNAWVTNEAGFSVVKAPALTSAFATTTYTGGGLIKGARGISIDRSGNIWVASTGAGALLKMTSSGTAASVGSFSVTNTPVAVANDSAGNAFTANFNSNSIAKTTAAGVTTSVTNALLANPTSIAIDTGGNVAVGTTSSGLCLTSNTLNNLGAPTCGSDGSLIGTRGVATSGTNEAYVGSTTGMAVTGVFDLTNNATGPLAGGGIVLPAAVAFDGAGHTWIANSTSISTFNGTTAISPSTGYGSVSNPSGIAIDASGNVWTANSGSNSLSIFVGLATPVTTPLAANVGP